jgi:hypothetical protein
MKVAQGFRGPVALSTTKSIGALGFVLLLLLAASFSWLLAAVTFKVFAAG